MTDIVERLNKLAEKHLVSSANSEVESMRQQLAESQALVNVLRANLAWYVQEDDVIESMAGNEYWVDGRNKAIEALALPSDSTALDSAIRQAKRDGGKEALLYAANTEDCLFNGLRPSDLRRMADDLK